MKKLVFRAGLAAIMALTVETASCAAIHVLRMKRYVNGPTHTRADGLSYARYIERQQQPLGWPLKGGPDEPGGARRDVTGARRLPAFPDPARAPSCVALYGDSFVESIRCDDEHEWANLVAQKLGCRVANYGRASYGSDQALMQYRLNAQDKAPVVILGHMHEDIRRNLTRIRDLVVNSRDYGFKPRFVLDARGELEVVPMPRLSEEQYERAIGLRSPLFPLEHENFQPGGPLVAPDERFPYTLSLSRSLRDYRVRARIKGNRPSYAELYEPGNLTQGLELMVAMARAFRAEAERRGQAGILLFLPPREVLSYFKATGKWVHQALLDQLKHEKIAYMDFGPYLLEHSADPLNEPYALDGHYNDKGNVILASMVAEKLVQLRMTGRSAQAAEPAGDAGRPVHP